MLEDLEKPQKIFMIIMYCLTGIALLFGCFSLYNLLAVEKPWTIGVVYADYLKKDDLNIPIINVKVNGNDKGNGQAVYDVQFNSYTDSEGNGIAGFGMQCIGDCHVYNSSGVDRNTLGGSQWADILFNNQLSNLKYNIYGLTRVYGDFYLYYTGDNNITYSCINYGEVDDFLLIDIKGSKYKLTLKDYNYQAYVKTFWDWMPWVEDKYETRTTKFTWFEVFDIIIDRARTSSGKVDFEEFSLSLFDISTYVDVQYMDEKGQYHSLPTTSTQRNYLTIPVEYSLDGALESKDSLFKQVAGSPTWSFYQNTEVNDYWKAYSVLVFDETYLSYYSNENGLIIGYLDEKFSEYLSTLDLIEIDFELNFNNNIVNGLDLSNFDFNIESITITNSIIDEDNFTFFNSNCCKTTPIYNGGAND